MNPGAALAPAWIANLFDSYSVTELGTLGGAQSGALAINGAGQVVGSADVDGLHRHAFRWSPGGGMEDLGTLGGPTSCATAINAVGLVVGYADLPNGTTHAFRWSPENGMEDLG